MGRPSKLKDEQWNEIIRRCLAGEKQRALAREFKVAESTLREKVSAQVAEIKDVAEQIVAADQKLTALPVTAQVLALSLAEDLKATSTHLASAAKYGAMTAHRLSAIAHRQTDQIDEMAPIESNAGIVKSVVVLQTAANEAARTGLSLLAANKNGTLVDDPEDGEKGPAAVADARQRNLSLIEGIARRASGRAGTGPTSGSAGESQ